MSFDEEEIKKTWVKRVKELMPKMGFQTYQDLAYKSGVSAGSLNQAMRGMHLPRQTTIEKIATALGTTPQFLLYGDTLKSVQQIPFLRTAHRIQLWLDDNQEEIKPIHYIELPGELDLTNHAFAWTVKQHDMQPVFMPGDLLIVDPYLTKDLDHLFATLCCYCLVLELSDQKKAIKILFGELQLTNQGLYLASLSGHYEPIAIEENYFIAGSVIQQTRNFKIN